MGRHGRADTAERHGRSALSVSDWDDEETVPETPRALGHQQARRARLADQG